MQYDLITRTCYTLHDVPNRLDWWTLGAFVKHLPNDSALAGELNADSAFWEGSRRVPMLLADLYDLLAQLTYGYYSVHSKTQIRKPKPYPRPGVKKVGQTFGQDAIAIAEFDEWWNS